MLRLSLEKDKREVSLLMEQGERFLELVSMSHEKFKNIYEKSSFFLKGREHLINKKEFQCFESFIRINIHDLILKERSLSSIILLSEELDDLLSQEDLFISRSEKQKTSL